ncbi:hypothetical protein HDV03_004448 [Kappamyces sp. JEL0829]|nr:hypothetical protein HDV03_004448 [Kappamyces sp. JEL0829]
MSSHYASYSTLLDRDDAAPLRLDAASGIMTRNTNWLSERGLNNQKTLNAYSTLAMELQDQLDAVSTQYGHLKKGLECGICLQVFCVPISIPCSHSFCYDCLLQCFAPPTGKGSDKTFFQVEKCPLCRAAIRLELTPSLILRDMAETVLADDPERREKATTDLTRLKKHINCIRLGAHCSGRLCLRPRLGTTVTTHKKSAMGEQDSRTLANTAALSRGPASVPLIAAPAMLPPEPLRDPLIAPAAAPNTVELHGVSSVSPAADSLALRSRRLYRSNALVEADRQEARQDQFPITPDLENDLYGDGSGHDDLMVYPPQQNC